VRRRLTLLPEGHEHALEFMGATHVLAIEIAPAWLRRTCGDHTPAEVFPLPATLYNTVWTTIMGIVSRASASAVGASLQALVEAALNHARMPPPSVALALIDELHVHWKDVPSVARLAQKYSLSTQYVCRVFKKATGVALQEYGLMLRLDHARELLSGSDLPIAAVAAEAGFSDQSHLTRALVTHSATTPLRLRWATRCLKIPPEA
jgi:AraC family transcriptional regulator